MDFKPGDILKELHIPTETYWLVIGERRLHLLWSEITPNGWDTDTAHSLSASTYRMFEVMDNCFVQPKAENTLPCSCDFFTVVLPYGCKCGGK
jgi:hypothetical protein